MKNAVIALLLVATFVFSYNYFNKQKYDFSLESEQGRVSLKDFRGKKLILYFGYTSCPDVCPTELSMLSNTLAKMKNAKKAQVIFISLDPERDDNITATNEWVRYFYKDALALYANPKELKDITKHYKVEFEKVDLNDSFMKYSIAHSGEFYLIDEKGNFLGPIKDLSKEKFHKDIADFLNS